MMMTSGGTGPHYKSMFDASSQIIAKEGVKSLFKGAGAVSSSRPSFSTSDQPCSFILDFLSRRTSCEESPVPVSCPSTTSSRSSCSARSTPVDLVKRRKETYPLLVLFFIYLSPYLFFLFGSHDFLRFHKTNSRFNGFGCVQLCVQVVAFLSVVEMVVPGCVRLQQRVSSVSR